MWLVFICVFVFACEGLCCLMRLCVLFAMYCVMLYVFVCCRCLRDYCLSVFVRFACDVWYEVVWFAHVFL